VAISGTGCLVPQSFATGGNQSYPYFFVVTSDPWYPGYKTPIEGCQRVRSKEGPNFVGEFCVEEQENERGRKKEEVQPYWRPAIHHGKTRSTCRERAPMTLAPLPRSKYVNCFPRGPCVKKVFQKGQNKKIHLSPWAIVGPSSQPWNCAQHCFLQSKTLHHD
jgi:hypothetical protein